MTKFLGKSFFNVNVLIFEALKTSQDFLPEDFLLLHQNLFYQEHLEFLATRLVSFYHNNVPTQFPPPHFNSQCSPPLSQAFAFFEKPLELWEQKQDLEFVAKNFADSLVAASCKNILLLLGQRLTPASITDARAIPPLRENLLQAAHLEGKQGLTVAARAWSKHAHRSKELFWGKVKGSTSDKNKQASKIITDVLLNKTWWNIFGHYKHELVYEARVGSGHGVRWGKRGKEFIGFLEPFDEE